MRDLALHSGTACCVSCFHPTLHGFRCHPSKNQSSLIGGTYQERALLESLLQIRPLFARRTQAKGFGSFGRELADSSHAGKDFRRYYYQGERRLLHSSFLINQIN